MEEGQKKVQRHIMTINDHRDMFWIWISLNTKDTRGKNIKMK